jgi:hypothetical protein
VSKEEDNSAFPLHLHGDYGKGMTLRDYFAAAALTGLIGEMMTSAANARASASNTKAYLADGCYAVADAMIEARKGEA